MCRDLILLSDKILCLSFPENVQSQGSLSGMIISIKPTPFNSNLLISGLCGSIFRIKVCIDVAGPFYKIFVRRNPLRYLLICAGRAALVGRLVGTD